MNESKRGLRYQAFRAAELVSLAGASSTVVKSAVAIDELTARMEALRPNRTRYVVAPNGRDLDEFQPGTQEERSQVRRLHEVPLDAPVVGYCGTMAPHRYPPGPIFGPWLPGLLKKQFPGPCVPARA